MMICVREVFKEAFLAPPLNVPYSSQQQNEGISSSNTVSSSAGGDPRMFQQGNRQQDMLREMPQPRVPTGRHCTSAG